MQNIETFVESVFEPDTLFMSPRQRALMKQLLGLEEEVMRITNRREKVPHAYWQMFDTIKVMYNGEAKNIRSAKGLRRY